MFNKLLACLFILFAACAASYSNSLPLIDGNGDTRASALLLTPQLVLTAAHAVSSLEQTFVCDKDNAVVGKLLRLDVKSDLALFMLDEKCIGVRVSSFAKDEPDADTFITIQGYPMGGPNKTTYGKTDGLLQIDDPLPRVYLSLKTIVLGGNSGGPVLNTKGELVGVVVGYTMCGKEYPLKATPTCRGLAVPLTIVKHFLSGVKI